MTTTIPSIPKRILLFTVLMALAAVTLASPAGAQDRGEEEDVEDYVQVRTNKTAAVVIGDTAWVTVSLRGKQAVEDLRVTASLEDGIGSVDYPTNTVDHSGPSNGYALDKKETDYVAFKVTIPADHSGKNIPLLLDVGWTYEGRTMHGTEEVRIPLVDFDGSPYTVLTETVAVSEANNGWVEVSFAGLAPRLESFEVTVTDPAGLDVYYPLETFTSLDGDALLEDGETDVVRFRMGESHWQETLNVALEVRYVLAGVSAIAAHDLTIAPA